jgi:preprotein translocase subunit SecD
MQKNLRWKILTIVAVIALAVWAFYPPQDKVKLGLDLKGGVHLVLRVQTDDALRLETETSMERLREELGRSGITVTTEPTSPTTFLVKGVPPDRDADFRRIANETVGTVFNRESGTEGQYAFTIKPNMAVTFRQEAVDQALQTIERRVNELGVAEPIVAEHGASGDQILVQLPGVTDIARAKEIIRSTAILELKLVESGPYPSKEAALQAVNNQVPSDQELLAGARDGVLPGPPRVGGDRPGPAQRAPLAR